MEHYNGHLPLWLMPIQVRIISFTAKNVKYGEKVFSTLNESGIRVDRDFGTDRMQAKVREAALEKVPYIIVVGDKEEKNKTVAIRTKDGKTKYEVKLDSFVKDIKEEILLRK